jgi:hypothetical protein
MTEKTAGQKLTDTLRHYFKVGPRTRRYRGRQDLHADMIEMIELNNQYPGYYNPAQTAALQPGYAVTLNYRKHIGGHRVAPMVYRQISEMTAWQFAALLGRMVDAGVSNTYEGELYFQQMTAEIRQTEKVTA